MSASGLFVIGALVTGIVAAALALLFYAAVLDGRYAAERKLTREIETRRDARREAGAVRDDNRDHVVVA